MTAQAAAGQAARPGAIYFPRGLIGLTQYRNFVLERLPGQELFFLLQSADDDQFGLVVTSPFWFMPAYEFTLPDAYRHELGDRDDVAILVTVTLAPELRESTANLLGPLAVNSVTGIGFQVVAADQGYPARYKLLS